MIGASRVRMFVGSDALSDAAVESLAPQRNLRCQHEAGLFPLPEIAEASWPCYRFVEFAAAP